jgi:glycine/D-amino acid oxidase-like deaminating enzyme
MNLRTGKPVWLFHEPQNPRFPSLRKNLRCDVAIVGAGITGALVAHQLLKAGLKVVVLDKRAVGRGSTAASTGLLLYQTDTSLGDLTRLHSAATAQRVYRVGRDAIRELGEIVASLPTSCGYRRRHSLYVAKKKTDCRFLRKEAGRSRRSGFPTTFLPRPALRRRFQLDRPGGNDAPGSAEINALQLTRAIFQQLHKKAGLRIFQHSTVSSIRENASNVEVRLANRSRIRASHVIDAAGYEAGRFVKSRLIRLHSTYVIASAPFPPGELWPGEAVVWETARPYFYLRTTADHRIIFGGRDEPTANPRRRDAKLRSKTRQLENDFAQLFPDLAFRAEFAWTGTFAETVDGLPCIGPKEAGSRIYHALGYGGNGITFSQIAAKILCDFCTGKKNRDAPLFRFDRMLQKRRGKRP